MEVPRLGAESELQLLAYATATAMPDPSQVCDLHYSSWPHRILNPLSKARDRTYNLTVTSRILFFFFLVFFCLFCGHMVVPRLGGEWEL